MSRTRRKNYKGENISEGEHAKKCPEPNCSFCVNGKSKKPWNKKFRRTFNQKKGTS